MLIPIVVFVSFFALLWATVYPVNHQQTKFEDVIVIIILISDCPGGPSWGWVGVIH